MKNVCSLILLVLAVNAEDGLFFRKNGKTAAASSNSSREGLVGSVLPFENYYSKVDRLVRGVLVPQPPPADDEARRSSSAGTRSTEAAAKEAKESAPTTSGASGAVHSQQQQQQQPRALNSEAAADLLQKNAALRWGRLFSSRQPLSSVLGFRQLWGAALPGSEQLHALHDQLNIDVEGEA